MWNIYQYQIFLQLYAVMYLGCHSIDFAKQCFHIYWCSPWLLLEKCSRVFSVKWYHSLAEAAATCSAGSLRNSCCPCDGRVKPNLGYPARNFSLFICNSLPCCKRSWDTISGMLALAASFKDYSRWSSLRFEAFGGHRYASHRLSTQVSQKPLKSQTHCVMLRGPH